jgi:hypothetical protein
MSNTRRQGVLTPAVRPTDHSVGPADASITLVE